MPRLCEQHSRLRRSHHSAWHAVSGNMQRFSSQTQNGCAVCLHSLTREFWVSGCTHMIHHLRNECKKVSKPCACMLCSQQHAWQPYVASTPMCKSSCCKQLPALLFSQHAGSPSAAVCAAGRTLAYRQTKHPSNPPAPQLSTPT